MAEYRGDNTLVGLCSVIVCFSSSLPLEEQHTDVVHRYKDFKLICAFVGLEFTGGEGTNYARKFDSAPGVYGCHLLSSV